MNKKKILAFSTSYYPFIGGAEIALEEIARRLSQDFDFFIITARFKRDLPKIEKRPEGEIIRVGFGSKFDKILFPILGFLTAIRVIVSDLGFRISDFKRPQGLILWGMELSHGSLAAAFLKFFFRSLPFIFTIQYGYGEERISRGRFGIINYAFRFILNRADRVTAISSHLLALVRKYGYEGQADLIPNGVDIQKFKIKNEKLKKINQKSKIVITTSRLVYKNGVDTLIFAIYEVKKSIPEIQCWIIGDGPERASYQLLITSYKLEENVKLLGAVPFDKIPEYLHKADIFARPSRSEGMGNSFIEALAAGLPIIGTPVEGILDIIQDGKTGFFTKVGDAQDLAGKIIFLINHPEIAKATASAGKIMVEKKFSWDVIQESFKKIFLNNLRSRPLKIFVLTPIYPPQIGGPARYAENLSREFAESGNRVKIISLGKYIHFPSLIRHLLYLGDLLKNSFKTDLFFSLDYTSVGISAAVASLIFRKPLVIRVEGDFLWESFVERTRQNITLAEFYKNPPKFRFKDRLIGRLSKCVMRRASKLVFSSEWRQQMVAAAYDVPLEKTTIIKNVFPPVNNIENWVGSKCLCFRRAKPRNSSRGRILKIENSRIILYAGRMLYLKNLHRLIRAFASINVSSYELHLVGEGPERKNMERLIKECRAENRIKIFPSMSHRELMKKLSSATALVLPSLSDVGPNIVAEAISMAVPVIMTKESGYAEIFRDAAILIDPLDETDLREKLKKFIEKPAERTVPGTGFSRSWAAAAKDWLNLFRIL